MSKKSIIYYFLLISLLGVFFIKGCGSSSSCSCMGNIPGGQPPDMGFKADKKVPNAVQARLSSSAINFLTTRLPDILALFLKDQTGGQGLTFPIPYSKSQNNGCDVEICKNGNCSATLTINSVKLALMAPDTINATINANLKTTKIRVRAGVKAFWCVYAECDIDADIKNKDINAQIKLYDDPFTNFMTYDIPPDKLDVSIQGKDININGGILCNIADLDFIKNLIIKQLDIKKQLAEQIPPMIAQQTCEACGGQNDPPCPQGSTCQKYNGDNYCVAASTNKCVARPLGAIGRMDLSGFLKDFAPGLKASLDLYAVAGDFPPYPPKIRDNGIDIQVIGGTDAERNQCVPETEPPKLEGGSIPLLQLSNSAAICQSCDPVSPVCPADSVCSDKFGICIKDEINGVCPEIPFMAGIGINEYFLRKFFWDAFNSGLLCLNIDSATVPQLTSGVLSMLLPSLKDLTDGKNTSVLISLRPTKAPEVKIGRGLLKLNGDKKEIFRPLILLTIPQLSIDFYAIVYDRYTRIFTLTADLELPIALDIAEKEKPDPNDPNKTIKVVELVPVLGDLTNAIKNISVSNSELLAERPEDIAKQLSSLIGTLVGPLLGGAGLSGFELPDLQGFVLKIRSISGDVPYDSINDPNCNDFNESSPPCYYKFLNIFADLDLAQQASPAPPYTPSITIKGVERGRIIFANNDEDYEYSFRINNGLWSFFMSGKQIILPVFETNYEAKYKVDVRFRKKGSKIYRRVEQPLTVIADFTPPEIDISKDAGGIIISARDTLTPSDKILLEYSYNGIDFVKVESGKIILEGSANVIYVRAIDEANNIAHQKFILKDIKSRSSITLTTNTKGSKVETVSGCSCNHIE